MNAVPAASVLSKTSGERVAGDGVMAASAVQLVSALASTSGGRHAGGARYSRGLSTVAANASTREEVEGKTATVGGSFPGVIFTAIDNNGNGRWRSIWTSEGGTMGGGRHGDGVNNVGHR